MALALLIGRSETRDPELEALRGELSATATKVGPQASTAGASVFAAAEAAGVSAEINVTAEREAKDVARCCGHHGEVCHRSGSDGRPRGLGRPEQEGRCRRQSG
jgi:hypothetical protein